MANIQWFPGHMAKTQRLISDNLKLVDLVVEVLDARIPISSKNPVIDQLLGAKPRLVILNKSDMADEKINSAWVEYFNKKNSPVLLFCSVSGKGNKELLNKIKETLKDKTQSRIDRGIVNRKIKIMVVGIPNVGKSSLINCLAGKKTMKVEDRPGVTRGKQWLNLEQGFELLDMPGILWPKFDDEKVGLNLAFCGAIKDDIMDIEEVAASLLAFLANNYKEFLENRYNVKIEQTEQGYDILDKIGKKRGFLLHGGDTDTQRAAKIVLDEFRGVKLGRISLERPQDLGDI